MKVGYGRGYYGEAQLAPRPRSGGGWGKLVIAVAVGTGVWLMWPRRSSCGASPGSGPGDEPPAPPSPGDPPRQLSEGLPPQPGGQPLLETQTELDRLAQARGYASQAAYEDAVVMSARQLQEAGATVALAPHLQHLAPRID